MEEANNYQVLVCNISWDTKSNTPFAKKTTQSDLPVQISLDIPVGVLTEMKKKPSEESNIVEQFVYNLLYKKFGHIANRCQIWLPLDA